MITSSDRDRMVHSLVAALVLTFLAVVRYGERTAVTPALPWSIQSVDTPGERVYAAALKLRKRILKACWPFGDDWPSKGNQAMTERVIFQATLMATVSAKGISSYSGCGSVSAQACSTTGAPSVATGFRS